MALVEVVLSSLLRLLPVVQMDLWNWAEMTALSNSRGFVISPILPSSTSFVTKTAMASDQSAAKIVDSVPNSSMKLLFVEMGVGYDQHGQDITSAAMRACRDAISSNSIPAFMRGSIPGDLLDIEKWSNIKC
ncbi:unnamed protein product [Fraxinus pennsylvanica]|uniref:Uncharacterized protein n=1 Tax=Fraxinus pennsylvanica TaxID=56036 RepID=A0AAD1ZLZ0_9LAMI|nr:unnamed protein product [Fraxinus pennsylvanica]